MTAVNLGLSILLIRRFGIIGAVVGTILALILVQVTPLSVVVRRELRKLRNLPVDADPEPAGTSGDATHS